MADFETELSSARTLLDHDDVTAFHVGVVRNGEAVETTAASTTSDAETDGMQTLTLLATHLRAVAAEADVDLQTVASDAAHLAARLDETR